MRGAAGEVLQVTLSVERLVDKAQADLERLAAQMRDEIGLPTLGGREAERLEGTTLLRAIEGSADPGQRDVAESGAERVAPGRRCRAASRAGPAGGAVESRLKVLLDVHE